MSIDEKKNSTGLFSDLIISKESVDNMCIEDYVLATLGVEKSAIENPEIFFKNYVHLMCHLCKDIREIEKRLDDYKNRYSTIENDKSNEAEFERRKLRYFCDLNKEALREINSFVKDKMLSFLLEHSYDTLNRECEKEVLSDYSYRTRYKYAWHRDYYSIDYPSGIIVKVSQYC